MMRFGCKTGAEKAWLVASVTALVLHRLLEVEPDAGGMWLVEGVMITLSLPFGPIAMFFILAGVEGLSVYTDLSWLLDWSTLLFVGYVQWFWVLPEIRRNNQPLTLNLTSPAETSPLETPPIKTVAVETMPVETLNVETLPVEALPAEIASTASPCGAATLRAHAPVVFDAAAFVPPLAEFDEAGLTPLERVLRAPKTSPHAPEAASSRAESIFSAAHRGA
jgi:hypothetical protein